MRNLTYIEIENEALRIRLSDIKKAAKKLINELNQRGYNPSEALEELKRKLE